MEEMKVLDICSASFSHSRAVHVFQQHPERMVCDVLLDQMVLPGVGNIIKNEVSQILDIGDKLARDRPGSHLNLPIGLEFNFSFNFLPNSSQLPLQG